MDFNWNGFEKLFLPAMFGVLFLSSFAALAGAKDDRQFMVIGAETLEKMLEVREKCAPLLGDTSQWETCMIKAKARETRGIDVRPAAQQTAAMRMKTQRIEKKQLYEAVSETHEFELLGRACAFVVSSSEVKGLIEADGLAAKYPEFFVKLALVDSEEKAEVPVKDQFELGVNGKFIALNKFEVMDRLLALVDKDSVVYSGCRQRVSAAKKQKDLEYNAARQVFQQEWKELKEFKGSDEAEKNRKLARAIEALVTARAKVAENLATRGAPAENVSAFVSYLADIDVRAENASFEQRKELLGEMNTKWRVFVKDMSVLFFKKKIEAQVAKLNAFILRANEAITGLEEGGASQERIALLKTASQEASEATDAVFAEGGSLRKMMKRLLVARADVRRLVKLIGKVKNGLANVDVEAEAVTDAQVANVPDVPITAAGSVSVNAID